MYVCKYEDEGGVVRERAYPRPQLVHDFFTSSTAVDDDNKLRQASLALEKRWPTQSPWRRLFTTFLGMKAVSFFRLMQRVDPDTYQDMTVCRFIDLLCRALEDNVRKVASRRSTKASKRATTPPRQSTVSPRRIKMRKHRPNDLHPATPRERTNGRTVPRQRQATCGVCRKWQKAPRKTTWTCPDCGLPLCSSTDAAVDGRKHNPRRSRKYCMEEHKAETDPRIRCDPDRESGLVFFPHDLRQWTNTAR